MTGHRNRPSVETQVAVDYSSMLHELRQDMAGHVDRYGKANTLSGQDDGRIDADYLAFAVDQWAAAVAGIQGGVSLDDVVHQVAGDAAKRSAERANNAGRH